ncbi:unnamed protein product [Schistosoma bovis]|nr:unnamed protein product [Schistosoma bovis]
MTSFNCFKIHDTNNFIAHATKTNNSEGSICTSENANITNSKCNQSVASGNNTVISTTTNSLLDSRDVNPKITISYSSYSRGSNNLLRCRPHFRHSSLSSSAFGTCMPSNKRDGHCNSNNNKEKISTTPSTGVQFSRNCFRYYPNRIRKQLESAVTKNDPLLCLVTSTDCTVQSGPEIIYTTSSSMNNGSGLVRSQSDSTCLSLKAIIGNENYIDAEVDQEIGAQTNIVGCSNKHVNYISDDSAQSSNISSWEMNNSASLDGSNSIDKYNLEISNKCTSLLPSLLLSLSSSLSTQMNFRKVNITETQEKLGIKTEEGRDDRSQDDDMLASFMRNSTIGSIPNSGFTSELSNYCGASNKSSTSAVSHQHQGTKLKCRNTPNNLSTPTTPSRSYQLICRNGIQSYSLVTEKPTGHSTSPENLDFVDQNSETSICFHNTQSSICCSSSNCNPDHNTLCSNGQLTFPGHLFNQHQFGAITPDYLTKSYKITNHSDLEISQSSVDAHIQPILHYYAGPQNTTPANLYSIISTSKECSSHPIPLVEISTSNVINASHSSQCRPIYSDSLDILNNSNTYPKTLELHPEPINLFSQVSQLSTGSTTTTTTTTSNNTTEKPTAPLPSRKQRPLSPSLSTTSITGVINTNTITTMQQNHTNISSVDHHHHRQQQAYTPKLLHNSTIAAVNTNIQSRTPSKSQGTLHYQQINPYQNAPKLVSGWPLSSSAGNRPLLTNNNTKLDSHQTIANSDQFITGTSGDRIINYYNNNSNYIHNAGISSNTITNNNTNNNIGFMNNNSGDMMAQNSPRRSPRTVNTNYSVNANTVESTYNPIESCTPIGGSLQASVSVHCSSNLLKPMSTSIPSTTTTTAAIFSGNVDSTLKNKSFIPSRINNSSSVSNHQTVTISQKHGSISSHPPPPPLPQQQEKTADLLIDDPANEMTISELRSIAERQRQQLARQAQQLQAREERRAWLRSLNSQRSVQNRCVENEKVTSKPSDLSQEQEIRLHKLRGFRGQTEQVRLSNENLVKEIDRLASLLSGKEHDLQVCRQRADEAERMLTLISQWHNVIASARCQTINQAGMTTTVGTNPTHLSDETSSSSSLSLPFMQPPFFSELDKKRWHDGLVEADRLDRQFALVFGRKPPIQTWSSSQSNLHFVNSLVSETKLAPHIPCSLPSITVPSASPPSYSTYHNYSKSRLIDQSPNAHDDHSPPPPSSSITLPHIPISHSTPVISRTPVTTIDGATSPNIAFSSVLTRDSSPPTSSRRSCFRTFMQLHPGYGIWSPNTTISSNNSCISNKDSILSPATIHPLPIPRIKAPPRYASRAVINDTYMRRICRDSVEKYKRTASEIYLAGVNKLNAKSSPPSIQSPAPTIPSSEWSNNSVTSEHHQQQTCNINSMKANEQIVKNAESLEQISGSSVIYHPCKSYEPDVITNENGDKIPDQNVHTSVHPTTSSLPSSPSISPSSSSSSLELIGIDIQPDDEHKLSLLSSEFDSPEDEQKQQNSGDVDSGLGGSDHTVKSEHQQPQIKKSTSILQMTTIMTPETTTINTTNATIHTTISITSPSTVTTAIVQRGEVNKQEISSGIMVYVDEEHGVNVSTNNNSCNYIERQVKSILRKSKPSSSPLTSKQSSSLDGITETTQSLTSSLSQSNSVRFHPLALLLDAALEGDLELVKKAASEVNDVSESNDEGITALHNAVCAGRVDVAEFLVLSAGADVNAGDTDGWTPLHCAASCGNVPLAKLLVEHGASLHARTLSDQETPLEKCDQGDEEAECEEYLYFQHERLGSAASGRVYALFPRGIEAAGPGSMDAHLEPDELPLKPNELLTIVNREPPGEIEWMLAENSEGQRGLVPRSHISCYPLVRIPPSSLPIMETPKTFSMKSTIWNEFDNDDDDDDDSDGDANTSKYDHQREVEYKLYDENQLLPERISKMQFVSSSDNLVNDNNNTTLITNDSNNSRPYTQATIEIEDITSVKSSSTLPFSEVKHYIPRPSSVDFTGLKTEDRQSSDEIIDAGNNKQTKTNETCDLATAF